MATPVSYDETVRMLGANYKAKTTITYKYDKQRNCISYLKTQKSDTKLAGYDLGKSTTYEAMKKEISYSLDDEQRKTELDQTYRWLLRQPYCPKEALTTVCGKEYEETRARFEGGQYKAVIDNWCDKCDCNRNDIMKTMYIESIQRYAEETAERKDYETALKTLNDLYTLCYTSGYTIPTSLNKDFEFRDRLQRKIREYEDEYKKEGCGAIIKSARLLREQGKYAEAYNLYEKLRNTTMCDEMYYKSDLDNAMNQCRIGMDRDLLKEAKQKYEAKQYIAAIKAVESLRKREIYTRGNMSEEDGLIKECLQSITAECERLYTDAVSLRENKDYVGALAKLTIPEEYKEYTSKETTGRFAILTEMCKKDQMCQEAQTILAKAETAKKNKDWQTVASLLAAVDNGYSHCQCYGDIMKLREKAEKKTK